MPVVLELFGNFGLTFFRRVALIVVAATAMAFFLALAYRSRGLRFGTLFCMPRYPTPSFRLGLNHYAHLPDVGLHAVDDF
jgi:hypothetical protein